MPRVTQDEIYGDAPNCVVLTRRSIGSHVSHRQRASPAIMARIRRTTTSRLYKACMRCRAAAPIRCARMSSTRSSAQASARPAASVPLAHHKQALKYCCFGLLKVGLFSSNNPLPSTLDYPGQVSQLILAQRVLHRLQYRRAHNRNAPRRR
jgi:hypothetical protein